eukprot:544929-Rhodomonas_salina.1
MVPDIGTEQPQFYSCFEVQNTERRYASGEFSHGWGDFHLPRLLRWKLWIKIVTEDSLGCSEGCQCDACEARCRSCAAAVAVR